MKINIYVLIFPYLLRVEGKHKVSKRQGPTSEVDLLPSDCGKSHLMDRISGGREARPGSWPWIVVLGYKTSAESLEFRCGGALISNHHVLTAAHCVHRVPLSVIRLGEHDLSDDNESAHEDFAVLASVTHEQYDNVTFEHDIALLTLSRLVTFKDHISPICLPRGKFFTGNSLSGIQAVVAGWGYIGFGQPTSSVLKEANVPIRSDEECKSSYAIFRSLILNDNRLCAGTGGNDACGGDSGGPLIVWDTSAQRYSIVGVVSLGYRCGEPQFPGIYVRVTKYIDWIEKNLVFTKPTDARYSITDKPPVYRKPVTEAPEVPRETVAVQPTRGRGTPVTEAPEVPRETVAVQPTRGRGTPVTEAPEVPRETVAVQPTRGRGNRKPTKPGVVNSLLGLVLGLV